MTPVPVSAKSGPLADRLEALRGDCQGQEAIGVPYQRVNEIVNRRRGITASTALRRCGRLFQAHRHSMFRKWIRI